jgi:WD40 repeat protein
VAFSPDGKDAFIGHPSLVRQLDVQTGQEVRTFTGSGGSLAVSPNGKYLVSCGCGSDRALKLWDLQTGQELHTFTGNTGQVPSVAFSPDSSYILSGGYDKTARIWDVLTFDELRRFNGHDGAVLSVKFSPDGKYVLTGGNDGTIRLWVIDYQDIADDLCSHLLRDFTEDERKQYNITDNTPACPDL